MESYFIYSTKSPFVLLVLRREKQKALPDKSSNNAFCLLIYICVLESCLENKIHEEKKA